MTQQIQVSEELFSRLEKLAVGFDAPEGVIERLADAALKANQIKASNSNRADNDTATDSRDKKKRVQPKRITEAMASQACRLGDQLYSNRMSEETARRALVDMGMNSSSALIYLYNFVAMMNGKVFKRSMKIADIRSYFMYIEKNMEKIRSSNKQ